MRGEIVIFFLICFVALCDALPGPQSDVEARGKKKKIALFVYFADILVKKFFILKLAYAFVFWLVIHKAGYFLSWFVSYLKEKKQEHYAEHHDHDHHYGPHHHYDAPSPYGPPSYGPNYGPYRRKNH